MNEIGNLLTCFPSPVLSWERWPSFWPVFLISSASFTIRKSYIVKKKRLSLLKWVIIVSSCFIRVYQPFDFACPFPWTMTISFACLLIFLCLFPNKKSLNSKEKFISTEISHNIFFLAYWSLSIFWFCYQYFRSYILLSLFWDNF